VADRAGQPIVVAGSIGPSGELFEPLGALTPESAAAEFAKQAQALAEGGVDLLWIETMSAREEVAAAVAGAATTGLPFVTTMSFDTNGRTMMGLTPAELAGMAHGLNPAPLGYGANCGTGAAELVAAIVNIGDAARPDDVIIAKGNCGVPYFVESQIRYDGTPALMADYARLARDAGARIIGGCCGTTPAHITAMREALAEHVPGSKPNLTEISERLGKLTAGTVAGGLSAEAAGRRPRRRRGADASF
jgi:5-methyltetrahydrofolate--homocysteine methyltransferase